MRHVPSDVIKPVSCCSCSRIHVGCRSAGSILHRNRPQRSSRDPGPRSSQSYPDARSPYADVPVVATSKRTSPRELPAPALLEGGLAC